MMLPGRATASAALVCASPSRAGRARCNSSGSRRGPRGRRRIDELLLATGDDGDAYAAFYRRHEEAVLRFFVRRSADAELALDLTAETFAAALVASRRFTAGPEPARAWLFGIAVTSWP